MLEAYYSPHKKVLLNFKNSLPMNNDQMFSFFISNKVNIKDLPLYFELLKIEISDLFNKTGSGRKTALQLEIDQVGSGTTFVALLTGNKELAKRCNLLEGEFECIYTYLLKETIVFFEKIITSILN